MDYCYVVQPSQLILSVIVDARELLVITDFPTKKHIFRSLCLKHFAQYLGLKC